MPIFVDVIADGKVYLGTTEHSPGSPWYKDARYRCINATDGTEIWTLTGWGTGMYVGQYDIVADGQFIYLNCYDMQIYSVGKGPSQTSVTASPKVSTAGSSVLIEGNVIDIAAGTKQNEQAARFPNGLPAVSDASMKDWMEYVYMQKPRPMDATGVPVVISVVDANGNYREIGTVTSDADGFYSLNWTLTSKANTQFMQASPDQNHTGHHTQSQPSTLTPHQQPPHRNQHSNPPWLISTSYPQSQAYSSSLLSSA